jgi:hypothetical protein
MEEWRNNVTERPKTTEQQLAETQKQLEQLKQSQPAVSMDQLKSLLEAVVSAVKAPNPIEQKAIDAQIEEERRHSLLAIELAKVEAEKIARRKAWMQSS